MASFVIGQPVTTAQSSVVVDAGLKPGFHRFQLVVVDDGGQASKPDEAVVEVAARLIPGEISVTPVVLNPDPIGRVVNPTIVSPLRPLRRPK
jgi:hypothetical protein